MKLVKAYIEGYSFTGTVKELQKWWDNLKSSRDFTGKTLKIWESKINNSTLGVYDSVPTKELAV
jgi:hypothetical protein